MRLISRKAKGGIYMTFKEEFVTDLTNPRFKISNYGRALYLPTNSIINPVLIRVDMYNSPVCWAMVNDTDYICIPRSVGLNFLKDDPNYGELIIHLDLNPMNNKVDNLKWIQRMATVSNSYAGGMAITDVHNVCLLLERGYNSTQIVDTLKLDKSRISMINLINAIKRGIQYPEISAQYNFTKEGSNKRYTDEEKHEICKLIQQGFSATMIAQKLHVPDNPSLRSIVSAVKHKKQWNSISDLYF